MSKLMHVRFFNSNKVDSFKFSDQRLLQIGVSVYVSNCIAECLFDNQISDTDYIICPLYNNKKDYQIGITGGSKQGDKSSGDILAREMGEEIGYIPYNTVFKNGELTCNIQSSKQLGDEFCHILHISNCKKVPQEHSNINIHGNDDSKDIRRKIAVIVYGNEHEIINAINGNIYRIGKNEDNISGLVAIPVEYARVLVSAGLENMKHCNVNYSNRFNKHPYRGCGRQASYNRGPSYNPSSSSGTSSNSRPGKYIPPYKR